MGGLRKSKVMFIRWFKGLMVRPQGQVKFKLAPIGLKLGENKPEHDGSIDKH